MNHPNAQVVACVACGRSEAEVPVTEWRLGGRSFWVCPDCLPRLIHQRAQVMTQWGLAPAQPQGEPGGDHA